MSGIVAVAHRPSLDEIATAAGPPDLLSIASLAPELGLTDTRRRVYERYFALGSVSRHPAAHAAMLEEPLSALLANRPELADREGLVIYAKTQTHNTAPTDPWLARLRERTGLARWDAVTLSMTHCASGLAALELVSRTRETRPVIVLAGEKCMHPATSVQPSAILGEAPVAALLNADGGGGNGGWRIAATRLAHAPRFHANPDRMTRIDRVDFERGFGDLLQDFLGEACAVFGFDGRRKDDLVVPYNLNLPLLRTIAERRGWSERLHLPNLSRVGHLFCADVFHTLSSTLPTTNASRVLVFAAGMGATFAAALISRRET